MMSVGLVASPHFKGATFTAHTLVATLGKERQRQKTDREREASRTERSSEDVERQAWTRLML